MRGGGKRRKKETPTIEEERINRRGKMREDVEIKIFSSFYKIMILCDSHVN